MTKYLAPLLLLILIGCKNSDTPKHTYFGGKIINPKSNYVILSDNYSFNDTIKLDKNNAFLTKYNNFKEGLYIFKHSNEHQYVYIQPSDSLLIRLNTWNFDESLVFSGKNKNAATNNLLIESFLQFEQDEKKFSSYFKLPQQNFLAKIDSLKSVKENILNTYLNNHEVSDKLLDVLNISLLYPVYTNLEYFAINNYRKDTPDKLIDTYYDFRNNIDANKDSLMFYSPYHNYAIEKIYNETYLKSKGKKTEDFTQNLLNSIDENVHIEDVKNKLLYNAIVHDFFKNPSNKNNNKSFFTFFKLNSDIEQKKTIQRLINDLKVLNTGEKFPDFDLVASNGITKNIQSLIKNKKTVLLLKDYTYASDEWVSSRFNFLIKKFPTTNFILVNLCDDTSKRYTKNVAIKHQYTLPKKSNVYNYTTSKFPRIVLINKNGIIQNNYTSLSSKDINQQINNL